MIFLSVVFIISLNFRILELKNNMVSLEFSEYHYFDDVISDLKLTPVSTLASFSESKLKYYIKLFYIIAFSFSTPMYKNCENVYDYN